MSHSDEMQDNAPLYLCAKMGICPLQSYSFHVLNPRQLFIIFGVVVSLQMIFTSEAFERKSERGRDCLKHKIIC